MKDCLLSNRTLLCMMSQLLETCQEFAKTMKSQIFGGGEDDDKENMKNNEEEEEEDISSEISRLENNFEKYLKELLAELTKLSSRTADNALFGLTLKLNYNEFYNKK